MKKLIPVFAIFTLVSCSEQPAETAAASGKQTIYTTNYPLAFFAEQIAGPDATVEVIFPEIDGDPAFWEPTDQDVAGFQNATLILKNGATYAKWMEQASLPESIQRDTSKAFASDYIFVKEAGAHTHGKGEAHAHTGTAFTTWIDFQQAIWQAEEVHAALLELMQEDKKGIDERFNSLAGELDVMHKKLLEIGRKLDGQPLVGSHPIYQYLARRYDLNLRMVHWEPDVVPDEKGVDELTKTLVDFDAKVMIWEDTPEAESVEKLEAMGIKSIVFNPAGNRPENDDFLKTMRANVAALGELVWPKVDAPAVEAPTPVESRSVEKKFPPKLKIEPVPKTVPEALKE
ncbi:MAG: metal ABC transporter substrate-binding protein [Verrucomicrobiales bacterium]